MYSFINRCLAKITNPESAHSLSLKAMSYLDILGLVKLSGVNFEKPVDLMGLHFPNIIGLSAGFDTNGDYIDVLSKYGFGFIEVGGVTPRPQPGNPKPRLIRISKHQAMINWMGFHNKGADYLANNLELMKYDGIIGINICKNYDTPLAQAINDYYYSFMKLAEYASYFTVNVSSPNTPELRDLQHEEYLRPLVKSLKEKQDEYAIHTGKYVPILIKLSPDLQIGEVSMISDVLSDLEIDGVIVCNSTVNKKILSNIYPGYEKGGLSGRPLSSLTTDLIVQVRKYLNKDIPIIASGGITDEETARDKISAGASLLQVHTGFVFRGRELLKDIKGIFEVS